jgi:hypothetical protein
MVYVVFLHLGGFGEGGGERKTKTIFNEENNNK